MKEYYFNFMEDKGGAIKRLHRIKQSAKWKCIKKNTVAINILCSKNMIIEVV